VLKTFKPQWIVAVLLLAGAAVLSVCAQLRPPSGPSLWTARIVAAYPHDPQAFTQGLLIHDGELYESTGQYGHSSVRRVDLTTGIVEQIVPINFTYFGEGLTILGDRIYQLTWKSQTAFVYDVASFELLETKRYRGEGWGLTDDDESLIVSDGSATLSFYDPDSFELRRTVEVRDQGVAVDRLNELEFIRGEIWANIWYEDRSAVCDRQELAAAFRDRASQTLGALSVGARARPEELEIDRPPILFFVEFDVVANQKLDFDLVEAIFPVEILLGKAPHGGMTLDRFRFHRTALRDIADAVLHLVSAALP